MEYKTNNKLHKIILDILSDEKGHTSNEIFEEVDIRLEVQFDHKKISDALYYLGSKRGWIVSEGRGKSRIYKINHMEISAKISEEQKMEQNWRSKYVRNLKKVVKDADEMIRKLNPEDLLKGEKEYLKNKRIYEMNKELKKLICDLTSDEDIGSAEMNQEGMVIGETSL